LIKDEGIEQKDKTGKESGKNEKNQYDTNDLRNMVPTHPSNKGSDDCANDNSDENGKRDLVKSIKQPKAKYYTKGNKRCPHNSSEGPFIIRNR
jgi:hypothetical protein